MRQLVFSTLFTVLFFVPSMAGEGDKEYAVSNIPVRLLNQANAVVRLEEKTAELQSLEKLLVRHHYVITILNEEGSKFSDMVEYYDRFNEIKSIEAVLYDAGGNKIKTLKNKDIQDVSGSSGMSLADDIRLKVHDFYYKVYPYTIEYTIEKLQKQTMFFPYWIPVGDEYLSVEKSVFSIRVPKDYLLRYKTFNYNSNPVITEADGRKQYAWQLVDHPGLAREYAAPSWETITPSVFLAPSQFVIEDYTGNMTDWNEFGKFQGSLNKDLDQLPDAVKQKVKGLSGKAVSVEEKVKALYEFLQSSTRYISIQLGIGGWRPFNASYVASKSYGDCKALSNYMRSLLKEAGIPSYYTLVKAGDNEDDIITDFPSRQFNHAILCVPNGNDTIWLECTSQSQSAGYMGGFTGNRHALLITEDGGKVVPTPVYGIKENLQVRSVRATLEADATLRVKVNSVYKAMQQDDLHMLVNVLSKDKVKEYLHRQLDFATYEVASFSYKEQKSRIPYIEEALDITVNNYATITGKRLFIIPNIMTRTHRKLNADSARKYDVEIGFGFQDIDSVEIELPKGYEAESIPKDVSVVSPFGKYSCSVKLSGNKLVYYRSMEHFNGRFPARDYGALVTFYETIYKADRNRVVLVRNETLKAF
jgi:hypothetical protein